MKELCLTFSAATYSVLFLVLYRVKTQTNTTALEVIPYTLAENAGMNPISIVTELRSEHAKGKVGAGEKKERNGLTSVRAVHVLFTTCLAQSDKLVETLLTAWYKP